MALRTYPLLRQGLFRLGRGDAETAHERTLAGLRRLGRRPALVSGARRWALGDAPGLARTVFGVRFPGPVGLAAGMDKNGDALAAWPALGFGFVEVGTVTGLAQPGNPRPRLFRLPASEAIVNRMGFNNHGAAALAARLAELPRPRAIPIGVSLGKSKVTPLEDAVEDYLGSLRLVHRYADYVAVNVSSPNTPGLRALQDREHLDALLGALRAESLAIATADAASAGPVPLLVKVAPDLAEDALSEVLECCEAHQVAGLIVANTTIGRAGVADADAVRAAETGGLSGAPVTARARELVRFVVDGTGGRLPVIGVGGVRSPDDALALLDVGASLVQVYTGLVYRGPGLVRGINRAVAARARSGRPDGFGGHRPIPGGASDALRAPETAERGVSEIPPTDDSPNVRESR